MNSIKGSLNVITGCGSGLGKATLRWFLQRGSGPVLGIDRNFADNFVGELNLLDEQKKNLILKKHNTFDKETQTSLKEFSEKHGPIDNLINVAGVAMAFTMISDSRAVYRLENAQDLLNFNTVGTFNMIRLTSQYMIDQGTSENGKTRCIVNASCISTTKPSIGQTFYAGTKAAIDSLTLSAARDLSRYNIRCNTINVGYFETPVITLGGDKLQSYLEKDVNLCPTRLGHPDEFAHLVQSIVENQMLNGCCIRLDGCAEAAQDRPAGKPGIKNY